MELQHTAQFSVFKSKNKHKKKMIQFIDPNVVQFEILLHLDDRSVVSLLSTCKQMYNILSIDEYFQGKLKIMDHEILNQNNFENSKLPSEQVDRVNKLFRLAYLNFRKEMFKSPKENFHGIVEIDPSHFYGTLQSQYLLLKRYVFSNKYDNDLLLLTHNARSILSSDHGFWRSHSLNFTTPKEKTVYYWSVLLTKYVRKISNSWIILIGFSERDSVPSLSETWIRSGYCVTSNAKVENSSTSYSESLANKEGDLIGIECYFQNGKTYFNVYLYTGEVHNFEFRSEEKFSGIVPMVSLVHSDSIQVVSVLPWDGKVETLKRFGEEE